MTIDRIDANFNSAVKSLNDSHVLQTGLAVTSGVGAWTALGTAAVATEMGAGLAFATALTGGLAPVAGLLGVAGMYYWCQNDAKKLAEVSQAENALTLAGIAAPLLTLNKAMTWVELTVTAGGVLTDQLSYPEKERAPNRDRERGPGGDYLGSADMVAEMQAMSDKMGAKLRDLENQQLERKSSSEQRESRDHPPLGASDRPRGGGGGGHINHAV